MSPAERQPGSPHDAARRRACGGCCTRLERFGVRLEGRDILRDINLHVHCGELTAIIGPNGAGKTTLFRAMIGELPHSGELKFVHLDGSTPFGEPRIGYVPQKLNLDPGAPVTSLDLFAAAQARRPICTGVSRRTRNDAAAALDATQAGDLLDRPLGRLSCGQLQRVLLALALQPLPDLLLLDEPVAGVDPGGIAHFYQLVSGLRRQHDLSILVISHDLDAVASVADRMILLNRAVIADGPPATVLAHPELHRTFGGTAPAGRPA